MAKKAKKKKAAKPRTKKPSVKSSWYYEYHIEAFPDKMSDDTTILETINSLGAQGWELLFLSNITTDDGIVRAWFIRSTNA